MMKEDNRNLLLAIVLSVVVLLGWQFFYGVPQMEKQKQAAQQTQQAQSQQAPAASGTAPAPATPGQPAGSAAPGAAAGQGFGTRDQALAASPRVRIDTRRIAGSISLTGARIDDVSLKAFRETVDPNSPIIVLLSPAGGPNAYYSDFGWVAAPGSNVAVPNAATVWTADNQTLTPAKPVTLSWDNGQGLTFKRVVSVDDNAMFTVRNEVENKGAAAVTLFPYGQIVRHGRPQTLGYYVLHEGLVGYVGEQHGLQEWTYDKLDKEPALSPGTVGRVWKDAVGGWVGITDKYWAATAIPDQQRKFEGRFSSFQNGNDRTFQADFLAEAVAVAPGATATSQSKLFAGAKEVAAINGYERDLQILRFDLLIDWGWFYFFTKPLFFLLDWIYKHVGNFGVAILIVTVLLKGLFFPLANKSYASMAKMKALQPEMTAIRERHADDKMKQQQALMELYKTQKINPIAGCWPVLLQIPVFFALYKILFITIEMRHAPFFGWIHDLAAPDPTNIFNLFGALPFTPPTMLHLGAWPIIMGITMFIQMKMNPEPPDPVQKMMFTWMPVFFTFLLGSFPAGLVIYWSWNNLLSVTQQGFIMKKNGVKIELFDNLKGMFGKKPADATAAAAPKPANTNKK